MQKSTSITDIPIRCEQENLLGIENYAKALADFIEESATPMTIGIQGEWGTRESENLHSGLTLRMNQNLLFLSR